MPVSADGHFFPTNLLTYSMKRQEGYHVQEGGFADFLISENSGVEGIDRCDSVEPTYSTPDNLILGWVMKCERNIDVQSMFCHISEYFFMD
jgi:hypothetical protein